MKPMSLDEWKAERQSYLDSIPPSRKRENALWRSMNADDEFYFNLGNKLDQREASRVPIAGAGTVQFLSIASDLMKVPARFFLPARVVYGLLEGAEFIAREKSGL